MNSQFATPSKYPAKTPINIESAINQEEFDNLYGYHRPIRKHGILTRNFIRISERYWRPFTSRALFCKTLSSFFPILEWFPAYQWKNWILGDIISGVTLAVLHVPKGIVNATLAKVQPVVGLYTSLFPVLLYMVFGTSMHNSLGSVALTSLMAGGSVLKICGEVPHFDAVVNNNFSMMPGVETRQIHDFDKCSLEVVTTLAFVVGLIHMLMGFLQLEILATYLSDQLISGFNLASGFHVVISQLPSLLGIRGVPEYMGVGQLFVELYHTLIGFSRANPAAVVIGSLSVMFLVAGKSFVDVWAKKRFNFNVPIPFDLILIIFMIILSYSLDLNREYGITIVAESPSGLPSFNLPAFDMVWVLLFDAASIALVCVANHISLVKMFGKKQDFRVDFGQEFYALGLSTSLSSFLPVFPPCSALGRTMVIVKTGNKTQLSGLFCSICLVLVIAFAGVWLANLPMCVLAAATIVSQQSMLSKFGDLKTLWPVSKIDFSIWVVAFGATLSWDVTQGLGIAVGFSLLTTILRLQFPRYRTLGSVDGANNYDDLERYKSAADHRDIFIFRFDAPLLFTNVAQFSKSIFKAFDDWQEKQGIFESSSGMNTQSVRRKPLKFSMSLPQELRILGQHNLGSDLNILFNKNSKTPKSDVFDKHLIIDCSGFTFVDYMGINALKEVFSEMMEQRVLVYFAASKPPLRDLFEASGFYKFVPKNNFYPTIRDAVDTARKRRNATILTFIERKLPSHLVANEK